MIDDKKDHSDELYTITLFDQSETGEKIPERTLSTEEIIYNKKIESVTASDIRPQPVNITLGSKPEDIRVTSDNRTEEVSLSIDNKQKELIIPPTKAQRRQDFLNRHGLPPVLTSSGLIAKQAYYTPPVQAPLNKKSFIDQAREYADKTHEKTAHIPFMCYWPSYEYMSQAQLNWYFYMRSCIRNSEYIETDLSYIFVYIYELINQVGVSSPDDGLDRIISIWVNYRNTYNKLDRYLTDWVGDYISYYKCDAEKVIELLKQEGLFLLMPTDMLADYYFKNDLVMPIELISRFSDYKLYESEFIKSEYGDLLTDYLTSLINDIRKHMNKLQEGSFEKRDLLLSRPRLQKKLPFQRALFHNPDNLRIETYPPYEQHKPFRLFITAVIKEFENQLRILTKYKGRLRPDSLPEDIKNLCKKYARNAFNGSRPGQRVEISIDRAKLLALMQDSDEVRKRLIEGNDEYDDYKPNDTMSINTFTHPKTVADDNAPAGNINRLPDNHPAGNINRLPDNHPTDNINQLPDNHPAGNINRLADNTSTGNISRLADNPSAGNINRSYDNPPAEENGSFRAKLSSLQQEILDFMLAKGTSSTSNELNAAFPAVLVGVEIDKINDIALEHIGDLLISFEADSWSIIEDYIDELQC